MGKHNMLNTMQEDFWGNLTLNNLEYYDYLERLIEMSLSVFDWKNVPDSIDVRFLELGLFRDGKMVFFKDEELDTHLCMRTMIGGTLSVYNIPNMRTAYAPNGYNRTLNENNSVLIFNNLTHTPSIMWCLDYARKLRNIDRIIDVNLNAQRTPVLITCNEKQKLTLKNLYAKYEGNAPVIYGNDKLDTNGIKCLNTGAPYLADRLFATKSEIWNEALTYIGIPNSKDEKKERMIVDEVKRSQGGAIASRYSKLQARQQACEQINKMFNLNMWCEFRDGLTTETNNITIESDGD